MQAALDGADTQFVALETIPADKQKETEDKIRVSPMHACMYRTHRLHARMAACTAPLSPGMCVPCLHAHQERSCDR